MEFRYSYVHSSLEYPLILLYEYAPMKFSSKTADLLSSLQLAIRAIGSDQTLPILQNVLIRAEGETCTLSATNLELSIVTSLPVKIEREGAITVPAKAILNFVQYNQDENLLLESSEGTQLKLKSNHAKATIAGEAESGYPVIASIEGKTSLSLAARPLIHALSLVTFACAKTTSRPVISGVYMRLESGTITLVGTDSYRLSEYKLPVENAEATLSCIIPAKFLEELRSVISSQLGKEQDADKFMVSIHLSAQQIEATVGPTKLVSRLIDGKFPDYAQVLPKEKATTVSFLTKELLTIVKRMHYFAREVNNNITFSVAGSTLTLSTKQTQMGKDESTTTVSSDGKDNKIAISSFYLSDFLSRIDAPELIMELSDKMHPAVFKVPGGDRFLHLIMPLRMAEE